MGGSITCDDKGGSIVVRLEKHKLVYAMTTSTTHRYAQDAMVPEPTATTCLFLLDSTATQDGTEKLRLYAESMRERADRNHRCSVTHAYTKAMRGNHPPTLGLSNTSDHPLDAYSTAYFNQKCGAVGQSRTKEPKKVICPSRDAKDSLGPSHVKSSIF
jgi:hypothetical protein